MSYASINLDTDGPSGKVEDIAVWNMSLSETTGRVSSTRKLRRHVYESSPELSHDRLPAIVDVDTGADLESSEAPPAKSIGKRRRVRATKENDSVSFVPVSSTTLIITP